MRASLVFSALAVAVFLLQAGMALYRGLSGIDSALFGLAAVLLLREHARARNPKGAWVAGLFALGFAVEIGYEFLSGGAVFMAETPGVVTVPLAHVIGAAIGIAVALPGREVRLPRGGAFGIVDGSHGTSTASRAMKVKIRNSNRKRKRTHGFLARKGTRGGRAIMRRRRRKGRKRMTEA